MALKICPLFQDMCLQAGCIWWSEKCQKCLVEVIADVKFGEEKSSASSGV